LLIKEKSSVKEILFVKNLPKPACAEKAGQFLHALVIRGAKGNVTETQ